VIAAARTHRNPARWARRAGRGTAAIRGPRPAVGGRRSGEGALSVRRDLHRVAGQGLVHEEPRADHSRRTVALPARLVAALRAHRAAHLEERITAGPLWQDHDLVFAQANGRPIESMSDWRSWKDPLREADVREVRLDDGRHTAATLLLSEGVHPRVVMEVLGHGQMRTTTDTYSHVMPALGRDAADRMGSAPWN
jgi:integrase